MATTSPRLPMKTTSTKKYPVSMKILAIKSDWGNLELNPTKRNPDTKKESSLGLAQLFWHILG